MQKNFIKLPTKRFIMSLSLKKFSHFNGRFSRQRFFVWWDREVLFIYPKGRLYSPERSSRLFQRNYWKMQHEAATVSLKFNREIKCSQCSVSSVAPVNFIFFSGTIYAILPFLMSLKFSDFGNKPNGSEKVLDIIGKYALDGWGNFAVFRCSVQEALQSSHKWAEFSQG